MKISIKKSNLYKNRRTLWVLLLLITFGVFFRSIFWEFTNWDDLHLIVHNNVIRSLSLSNIRNIFSSYYVANYQPLTMLTWAVEYRFFELDPKIYHFNNLVLHIINVLLVFLLISKISGNSKTAFIVAILFAIHPMRVESVTWASERKDVLYSMFYLLSLNQYIKYVLLEKHQHSINKSYFFAILLFLLSCLSKSMAVSLSVVLILIDYIMQRKFTKQAIFDKIPFFVISIVFGLVSFYGHDRLVNIFEDYDIFTRIQYTGYVILFYIYKLVLPVNLSVFYPYPYPPELLPRFFWLFPILCVALFATVLYSLKYTRKIFFGFSFFIVTIALVLQVAPVNESLAADHYSYIAFLGLFYLIGEGYSSLTENTRIYKIITIAFIIAIFAISYLSYYRIGIWKNSLTLWNDAAEKYPGIPLVYNNRGNVYKESGEFEKALLDYNRALKLKADYASPYINIGNIKNKQKDHQQALLYYNKALSLEPGNSKIYANRGTIKFEMGDVTGAFNDFEKAIEINPEFSKAYYNMGNARFLLRNYEKAIVDLNKAIKLDKRFSKAFFTRANTKYSLHDLSGACGDWAEALRLGYKKAEKMKKKYCDSTGVSAEMPGKHTDSSGILQRYKESARKLRIVEKEINGKLVNVLQHYDIKGRLAEEGVWENGKYSGEVKWYYPDGTISITGYYNDTVPFGNWKEYYENGKLKAQYVFKNGKQDGNYKYYHRNGQLWTERIYKDGKLWEIVLNYNDSGVPLEKGNIKKGTGTVNIYSEAGTLVEIAEYRDGVRIDK